MNFELGNPAAGSFVLFGFAAVALAIWTGWARWRAVTKFGLRTQNGGFAMAGSVVRKILSTVFLVISILFLAIAMMDIRWGKTSQEVPQQGIEVVFALDVSRSMLAQDAAPNRLVRAKQQINDMIDEMAGDRIGLVAFAGEAKQVVPLTSHYDDFRQILDSVGPDSVARGGSQLGVAIEAASKSFLTKTNDHKTIILFTDGEDQESKPVELATKLHAENGTRIFTVGLGDLDRGARIPDTQSNRTEFVEHQGEQVWSKLNGRILREIATQTNAAYIPAGTKQVNMSDVYHRFIANIEQTEFETATIDTFIPRYQWFAGLALFFLLAEVMFSKPFCARSSIAGNTNAVSPQRQQSTLNNPTNLKRGSTAAAIFILCSLQPGSALAQQSSIAQQINTGNELVRQQKHVDAIDVFNKINNPLQHGGHLNFNLAVAHYRNSDYDAAITLLSESAKSTDNNIAASSRYNLGNCHYAQAVPLTESQPDQAVNLLNEAIDHYRSALRIDRKNSDARTNIELAKKLIDQIKQQQTDQQQNQNQQDQQNKDQQNQQPQNNQQPDSNQQQPQEKQSDQPNENSNSQQNPNNQSNEQPQNEQQDQGQQDQQNTDQQTQPNDSANQQNSDDQSSQKTNSETQANESQSDSSRDAQQSNDREKNPANQRNQAQQPSPEQLKDTPATDPNKPEPSSQQPADGKLSTENQPNPQPQNARSAGTTDEKAKRFMTREEALKMLQAVRDRDLLLREFRRRRQQSRRTRVEKDW